MKAMLSGIASLTACPLENRLSQGNFSRNLLLRLSRAPNTIVRQSHRIRQITCTRDAPQLGSRGLASSMTLSAAELHTKRAWDFWRKLDSPKYHVAPMVDQVSFPLVLVVYPA